MKRNIIKLFAYLENNFGDDLMVDILAERYPDYTFLYCHYHSGSKHLFDKKNVTSLECTFGKWGGRINHILNIVTFYKNKDFFLRWVMSEIDKRTCCSVNIGGSIFIEGKTTVSQRMQNESYKLKCPPLFVIGANFGPWKSEEYYKAYNDYFPKCGGVVFRDKKSYGLFEHIENVSYAPDVVFNISEQEEKRMSSGNIVISVIDTKSREELKDYAEEYEYLIVELCKASIAKNKTPILVSFCRNQGDETAVERISHRCMHEGIRVEHFFYYDNLETVKNLFITADFVVATRFHAMILALCYKKPFYALAYDGKIKNVLEDLKLDCYCEFCGLKDIKPMDVLENHIGVDINEYRKNADQQFVWLDRYLQNRKGRRKR